MTGDGLAGKAGYPGCPGAELIVSLISNKLDSPGTFAYEHL